MSQRSPNGVPVPLTAVSAREIEGFAARRLAAIVESSADAIISKDLNGIIQSWNRGAERLFGYTETEAVGKPVTILIPPDRHDEEPDILARIRHGERIEHYETVRQRKDGALVQISLSVSPIVSEDGRVIGASKIARDITEQKAAEEFKDTLIGEMKHRVKNSLTLASSIAAQTFHSATDEERKAFTSRLRALADAHEILSRQTWESADLGEVVARTMKPHLGENERIEISGPSVAIDPRKAVTLALALHELATNAMKYGALSQDEGAVAIDWVAADDEPDRVRLRWQERDGPIVRKPQHAGFGSRLIQRNLAAEFEDVVLEFRPRGVCCSITFSRMAASG